MSKENLDQFIQKVTDDEQLQARIGEEIDIESLIALGVEYGFEFTAEDLADNAELSDEELDGVAGGYGPRATGGDIGHIQTQSLLDAEFHVGVDTVGQSLRSADRGLRTPKPVT